MYSSILRLKMYRYVHKFCTGVLVHCSQSHRHRPNRYQAGRRVGSLGREKESDDVNI